MSKIIRGKCLVKKDTLANGTEVLVLAGVFLPTNFKVDDISNYDEMWVADFEIKNGLKFSHSDQNISPQDFITGLGQDTASWKTKSSL